MSAEGVYPLRFALAPSNLILGLVAPADVRLWRQEGGRQPERCLVTPLQSPIHRKNPHLSSLLGVLDIFDCKTF